MATPKTPQDHKPSDAEIADIQKKSFSEIEGHEHIKPFSRIKGSDQMRIIGRLKNLGITSGKDNEDSDLDLDGFADFVDWIAENYTVDQKKFEEWSAGDAGMIRTMKLAMGLLSELGKGMGSVSS